MFGNVSHSGISNGSYQIIFSVGTATNYATIGGGTGNQIGATGGTIPGGSNGTITTNGVNAFVFGGNLNVGHGNTAAAGGTQSGAWGNSSFSFGTQCNTFSTGSFADGSGNQVGSGTVVTDGAITATSSTLTCSTSAPFTAGMTTTVTATAATWTSGVVTITAANTFVAGQSVLLAGFTPSGYNGIFTIASASSTQFTFALASNPGTETVLGTATVGCVVVIPARARIRLTRPQAESQPSARPWSHSSRATSPRHRSRSARRPSAR